MDCYLIFAVLSLLDTTLTQDDNDTMPALRLSHPNITLVAEFNEAERNDTEASNDAENTVGFIESNFPVPSSGFPEMVEAAKNFVRQYLSVGEWLNMKKLLRVIKEIGGTQRDNHRAISIYLGRVLSEEKRREIKDRKEELEATFSRDFAFR